MSSRLPPSRGILRSSSYTPGDTSSSDGSDDSSAINRKDRLTAVRRLPGRPVKPERRNVGKVVRGSPTRSGRAPPTRGDGLKGNISFSNKVHVKEVPTIERSKSGDFFYDDDEIAEFRYQAHMEACGLDPADFD
jgi:hypothetical protein